MTADPEELRRRLYLPGATDEDVQRYRAAERPDQRQPTVSAAPSGTGAGRDGRRVRLSVVRALVGVTAVAAVALAVAALAPRPSPPPVAAPRTLAPPFERTASSIGLEDAPRVQHLIDQVFEDPGSDAYFAAVDDLNGRIRSQELPTASGSTLQHFGGGQATGHVVLQLPQNAPVVVDQGAVILLSVVSDAPTLASWQVLGRRAGEPYTAHPVLEVRPASRREGRVEVAVLRVPEELTIDRIVITTAPRTAFQYRVEQHEITACTSATDDRFCAGGADGTSDALH